MSESRAHSAHRVLPMVFVSYSRRDFYFAEAVTATLKLANVVDPWMDVHHLQPGTNWAETIDQSLAAADALFLVASPAALSSTWVRREWTQALARGIPVYVGIVEAVDLPDELIRCPVYDLRARFWRPVTELGRVIMEKRTDAITVAPRPNWLRLPTRIPMPLSVLVALSGVISIAVLWATAILVTAATTFIRSRQGYWALPDTRLGWIAQFPGVVALTLAVIVASSGITVLVVTAGLLWRRSSFLSLIVGFFLAVCAGLLMLVAPQDVAVQALANRPRWDSIPLTLTVLGAGTMVVAAVGISITWSRTVHLWLPTNEGNPWVRLRTWLATTEGYPWEFTLFMRMQLRIMFMRMQLRINWGFRDQWEFLRQQYSEMQQFSEMPSLDRQFSVEVHSATAEEATAELIRAACRDANLSDSSCSTQWIFVLVSSQIDWAEAVEMIRKLGSRAICVLIDSMRLPLDAEEARCRQWLDFRDRRASALLALLPKLQATDFPVHNFVMEPISTDRFRAPPTVVNLVHISHIVIGFFGTFSVGLLVVRPLDGLSIAVATVSAFLIALIIRLQHRTTMRWITTVQFRRMIATAGFLLMLWTAVVFTMSWDPLGLLFSLSSRYIVLLGPSAQTVTLYVPANWAVRSLIAVILVMALPIIISFSLLILGRRNMLQEWLPRSVTSTDTGPLKIVGAGVWSTFTAISATLGFSAGLIFGSFVR